MTQLKFPIYTISILVLISACTPQPTVEVPEPYKKGQTAFHKTCSNCHGSDAMGKHTKAPRLIDTDYFPESFSDDEIREAVLNGTDKMPPQKNKVTSDDIKEIIKYLRYSQKATDLAVDVDEEEDEA